MATIVELSGLELFGGCAAEDLAAVLPVMTRRPIAEGEIICREGDKPDRWWIVVDGTADVTTNGLYTATVGPGETIGELALLDGQVRSSTVRAVTDMVVQEVPGDAFLDVLAANPRLSLALLRELAGRLRTAIQPRREPAVVTTPVAVPSGPGRAETPPAEFDPFTPEYRAAPWRQLGALREVAPVQWSDAMGGYLVLKYDDVARLAKDRSLPGSITTGTATVKAATTDQPKRRGRTDKMMIRRDGEDHLRLRRLLWKAFTPRAVQHWREATESIVNSLLDEAAEARQVDAIRDYALPIPSLVISDMIGVPRADNAQLQAWSDILITNLEPGSNEQRRERVDAAGRAMLAYLEDLVADRRARPGADLLTAMIHAEDSGDVLDDEEIQAQLMLLYIAGHETTVNLIGNGLHHLFEHPDQLAQLRVDPELDANAVEEFLRFDSPAQFTRRTASRSLEVGGVEIPAGSLIVLALASANHDPAKWGVTADALDIARPKANDHVSFGGGPHFCLGASLARMEAQIALGRLIRRFPALEPQSSTPAWSERVVLRGLSHLPVRV